MSTVDISRFAHGLPTLLAPAVREGQTFYAFLEKENSLAVQADNVLKNSVSVSDTQETQGQTTTQTEVSEQKKGAYFYIHLDYMTVKRDGEYLVGTVCVPIGPLNPDTIDRQKLIAIAHAYEVCSSKSVYILELVDQNGDVHWFSDNGEDI